LSEEIIPPRAVQELYFGYHSSYLIDLAMKLKSQNAATDAEMSLAEKLNAIIEAAFLISASDGEMTDKEFEVLVNSTKRLCQIPDVTHTETPYRGDEAKAIETMLSAMDINTSLQSFAELLDAQGYEKRIAYVADVLSEEGLRQKAFMIAVDIAMTESGVSESENQTIQDLAKAFGFTPETTKTLIEQVEESRKKPA
jgi:tellurite resistance protein